MSMGRIVIANDEEHVLKVIADRLEHYGLEVFAARDGRECLELVARHEPDLVLLDVRMPGMNGIEVLDALREQYADLPALMVSASVDREVVEACLARGAVGYILKPFEPAEFKEKVFQALKRRPS